MQSKDFLPPDIAFQVAFSALENANRLHAASVCLFESQHFGPAMSLSISSREEIGKFAKTLMIGIEKASGESALNSLRKHNEKQALGAVFALLPAVFEELATVMKANSPLNAASAQELILRLMQRMDAAAAAVQWPTDTTLIDEAIASAMAGADEATRRRGLYVDPICSGNQWKVLSPANVSESEAAAQIATSGSFLGALANFGNAVQFAPETDTLPPPDVEDLRKQVAAFAAVQQDVSRDPQT